MSRLGAGATYLSRAKDREKVLWAGGTVFDIVLAGEHTAGAVALLDLRGKRGDATPMHLHRDDAEILYVLEGGIRAWAAGGVEDLSPGDAVYLPSGEVHGLAIVTESARLITLTAPAGFADFVAAAGERVSGPTPLTWDFDVARLVEAAPSHGIEIVGPPPSLT